MHREYTFSSIDRRQLNTMDKYKELIERLRDCDNYNAGLTTIGTLENEAADAIEELMRRNNNQMEYVQEALDKKDLIIEEVARRDTTDGTIKVFSGKEIIEIVEKVWRD